MRIAFIVSCATLVLAGCGASVTDAPSLAPRPTERQPILAPDAASEPQSPADPALAARLAGLVADARAGHAAFERERAGVAGALARARGATEGSEAWIAGQQARSVLEAAIGPVQVVAAAIDALRVDPAHAGVADRAAVEDAASQVATLADAEAAVTGGL